MKQRMPLFVLSFCFLTICAIVFFAMPEKQSFTEPNEVLAVFLGEEKSKTFPEKNSGYVYNRTECTNDELATWNEDTWKLTISKIKKETKCNVYFVVDFTEQEFVYSGETKEFIVPKTGDYKLEVWGAQGGQGGTNIGGKGGYSVGIVSLEANTKLYVNVGGKGMDGGLADSSTVKQKETTGGFNGGGNGYQSGNNGPRGAGGGATDIRIGENTLFHRVIVAGGGGGGYWHTSSASAGGAGGGLEGKNGKKGNGGSQIAGGTGYVNFTPAKFGLGGTRPQSDTSTDCGGGGGWYGGGAGNSAGGGSGWIYTEAAFNTWQTGNPTDAANWKLGTKYYLKNAQTIAGDQNVPTHNGTSTMIGNAGDGYAKITLVQ